MFKLIRVLKAQLSHRSLGSSIETRIDQKNGRQAEFRRSDESEPSPGNLGVSSLFERTADGCGTSEGSSCPTLIALWT